MNKIGEGYWYNVFELPNNRVRKVEKTFVQKIVHVFRFKKKQPAILCKTVMRFVVDRPKISDVYAHVLSNNVDLALLANPNFLTGIDYTQDRVKQLEDVFAEVDVDTQKKLIDQYIDHVLISFKYGLFETKFNFLENNGLSNNDSVVLHDFNEVTLNKKEVKDLVVAQRWQYSYSVRCLHEEVKKYYLSQMEDRVTTDELEARWLTALSS